MGTAGTVNRSQLTVISEQLSINSIQKSEARMQNTEYRSSKVTKRQSGKGMRGFEDCLKIFQSTIQRFNNLSFR